MGPQRVRHNQVHTMYTVAKKQKQPRGPSMDDDKMSIPEVEQNSAIKNKCILIHATAWVNLENTTLSE